MDRIIKRETNKMDNPKNLCFYPRKQHTQTQISLYGTSTREKLNKVSLIITEYPYQSHLRLLIKSLNS